MNMFIKGIERSIKAIVFIVVMVALFVMVTHEWWVEAFSRMLGG